MDLAQLLHDSSDDILVAANLAVERTHLKNYLRDGQEHRAEDGDLRLRAPDGGGQEGQVLGVRDRDDQAHG